MRRELWDREAATFDDQPDHGLQDPATREAWRALLVAHLPQAPAHVLDVGCGTGALTRLLTDEGYRVDGIDFSPEMVHRAQQKVPEATIVMGDAGDPHFPAGTFDAVLARHVLWALPDPAAAVSHWVGMLRPGGTLVLIEGKWSTGGGLTAGAAASAVHAAGREKAVVHEINDPALWGKAVTDERYLLVSTS